MVLKKTLYDQVLADVRATIIISPNIYKQTEQKIALVVSQFQKLLKKARANAIVCVAGSAGKGTYIPYDFDVDIFVRFSYAHYNDKDLSEILAKIFRQGNVKVKRIHGSRDYFQLKKEGITYEIIPVLHVTTSAKAVNVTDMSPLHVVWVKKQLKKNKQLATEIILTKLFCKAQNLYGAESYIHGFSGHVLDILLSYYQSFFSLAKAAAQWKPREIIDIEKHYRTKEQILRDLNKAKLESPLVLIDPLQPNRNAAAALHKDVYQRFIAASRAFLANPSATFFVRRAFSLDALERHSKQLYPNANLHVVTALPKKGKEDVVGTKLLKAFLFMKERLEYYGFVISVADWHWEDYKHAYFWFVVPKESLSSTKIHSGPPEDRQKDVVEFKKKYGRSAYKKDERWYATVERKYTSADALLKDLCEAIYIKERTRKISIEHFYE